MRNEKGIGVALGLAVILGLTGCAGTEEISAEVHEDASTETGTETEADGESKDVKARIRLRRRRVSGKERSRFPRRSRSQNLQKTASGNRKNRGMRSSQCVLRKGHNILAARYRVRRQTA